MSEVEPTVRKLADSEIDRGDQSNLYRTIMGRVAGGVSVILSGSPAALVGMTVNSLVSVSLDPLLILFCARLHSTTAGAIIENGRFSVNILSQEQQLISRHFAGRRAETTAFDLCGEDDHVWIKGTVGTFLCAVDDVHRAGDHNIIVGRIDRIIDNPSRPSPLIYHEGLYRSLEPAGYRA
jgi:3-hydroxy-9,10-secoandrosta-1,3,5(10)-triene-9,17-dione monooxygenase reductase component